MMDWARAPELVPLERIVKDELLQVRSSIHEPTVKKYAEQMTVGVEFPPIRIARVDGVLLLVDGWHRVAATWTNGTDDIPAVIADMTREAAIWEAARANLTHGLPLARSARREVFRAYVRGDQHKRGRKLKSYRDMAYDLGGIAQYTTIRGWMQKDFKSIFRAMGGGGGHLNPNAGPPKPDLDIEYQQQAFEALDNALNFANLLRDPVRRYEVISRAEGVVEAMKLHPHEKPDF
jgi:hypothetical protein